VTKATQATPRHEEEKMRKIGLCSAATTLAITLGLGAAHADGLPGMRGHDHTGITVPDMKQAVDFFVDVLGCQKAMSFGPFSDSKGTFMKDALDVNPRAVITQITMIRCGFGSNIELFSYQSPDQQVVQPKNSDVGGYHIAFRDRLFQGAVGTADGGDLLSEGHGLREGRGDDSLDAEGPCQMRVHLFN
jgi:catechol 2,3-dioxygenase-like lactoylglutathione lyase family enzyme